MEAFLIKSFSSLLIIALMTSSVVTESLHLGKKNGSRDRTLDTENKTKEDCNEDTRGIRRVVQYVYNDPARQCYTQFFVGGQPPTGLRHPNNGNIRYICQPPEPGQQQPQNTMYATMFDEQQGIAVFAAYTLTNADVKPANNLEKPSPWCPTPGIQNQGSQRIYGTREDTQRGHLVPAETYSSSQKRYDSTYTYTNAVPQKQKFNGGTWSQFERRIRDYASLTCTKPQNNGPQQVPAGTLYLLTGTSFVKIEKQQNQLVGVADKSINEIGNAKTGKISVPRSMWTAGCCVRQNHGGFTGSFAVIANNVQKNEQPVWEMTVAKLQGILERDAQTLNNVNLFPGDQNCQLRYLGPLNTANY